MSTINPHLIRIQIYGSTEIFSDPEHLHQWALTDTEHLIDEDELAEGEEGAGPHPHLLDPPLTRTVEL